MQLDWRPVAVVLYMYTNMNYGTDLIKIGGEGVVWEACSSNLESWEPSQHSLLDRGKQENLCRDGRSQDLPGILKFSQQSGN
jgi:hypothetical protein